MQMLVLLCFYASAASSCRSCDSVSFQCRFRFRCCQVLVFQFLFFFLFFHNDTHTHIHTHTRQKWGKKDLFHFYNLGARNDLIYKNIKRSNGIQVSVLTGKWKIQPHIDSLLGTCLPSMCNLCVCMCVTLATCLIE